jgi:hypothetical protein
MRLARDKSYEEVRSELSEAAGRAWGDEELAALAGTLDVAARCIWTLMQHPLEIGQSEPEHPSDVWTVSV